MTGFKVINCTEAVPGVNGPVRVEERESAPPEGFVDNTVRVYKMMPDGSKGEFLREEQGFPEGFGAGQVHSWRGPEDTDNNCMEGDVDMGSKASRYHCIDNWPEIIERGMELMEGGLGPSAAARKLIDEFKLAPLKPQSVYPRLKKAWAERVVTEGDQGAEESAAGPTEELPADERESEAKLGEKTEGREEEPPAEENYDDGFWGKETVPSGSVPEERSAVRVRESEAVPEAADKVMNPSSGPMEPAFDFDLALVKVQLIATTLDEHIEGHCPAWAVLLLVYQILGMEVEI